MTMVPRKTLKLKLTTQEEIDKAGSIYNSQVEEFGKVETRMAELEAKFPSLWGDVDTATEELPEGLQVKYDKLVMRRDALAKTLMEFPGVLQAALEKQQNTRNKAGELVSSTSVGVFILRMMALKSLVPAQQQSRYEAEAREIYEDFLRENPAAILSRAGAQREAEDE